MTAYAFIDHVEQLELDAEYGVVHHLVRLYRVVGLTDTDYRVLTSALAQSPSFGALLPVSSVAPDVVVTKMSVKLVDKDKGIADVTITYDHLLNEGQSLDQPPYAMILGRVQTSVAQATRNTDFQGIPLKCQYTFPDDDLVFGGLVKSMSPEAQFFQPQSTRRYQGIKQTNYPWLVQQSIVGATNNVPWAGGEIGTWLCVAANWEPYAVADVPAKHKFTFEFQYYPDGVDPVVFYKDPRTGAVPDDPLPTPGDGPGAGSYTAQVHPQVNLEEIMGQRVQGG